jgi:tetratricopeptide (TPR) repeat protein
MRPDLRPTLDLLKADTAITGLGATTVNDVWWVLQDHGGWLPGHFTELEQVGYEVDRSYRLLTVVRRRAVGTVDNLKEASAEVLMAIARAKPEYVFDPAVTAIRLLTSSGSKMDLRVVREAITWQPRSVVLQMLLGERLSEDKDFGGAIAAYRAAVELEGRGALAFEGSMRIGGIYMRDSDWMRAGESFEEAARRFPPWSLRAFAALGEVRVRAGDDVGGGEAFRQAIERGLTIEGDANVPPLVAGYYVSLSEIQLRSGDVAGARRSLESALLLQPDLAPARERLGRLGA